MAKYKCRKCGSEFISYNPLVIFRVCDRCLREKEQFKIIKNKLKGDETENKQNTNGFIGCATIIVLCIGVWVYYRGCAIISYWDKIYVKNNVKTYSTANFDLQKGGSEIIKFDESEMLDIEMPIYNKATGEEKIITLKVPLYIIWTKEISRMTLDGKKIVTAYEQPVINSGYNFIKPSNAIIENSKEYNQIIGQTKYIYSRVKSDFKNYTFDKNKIQKHK